MNPRGLLPHTHAERTKILQDLLPLFQAKFGADFTALAASASYARHEDKAYSDLEATVFVRQLPAGEDSYIQRIVDGMLVEIIYTTPEDYLHSWEHPNREWYMAASDVLEPVYNAPFIEDLVRRCRAFKPERTFFLRQAAKQWFELQESFAKTLTAIDQGNRDGLGLLFFDALRELLIVLSFLNQQPYVTFSRFLTQARGFPLLPAGFQELADLAFEGSYVDTARLRPVLLQVFASMERIMEQEGVDLYGESLDPSLPNRHSA